MGAAPARLSPLDAAFLYFERPHQRLYVGCVAILEASPGFGAFARAVEERLCRIERYRERPIRPPLDLGLPRWEIDPHFEVRRHVRHVAVPPPGDDAALEELVDTLFATQLDPEHPLWEMYLIDGLASGRSAVLCKTHHSMIDGVSGAQVLEVLADPLPGAGAAPLAGPTAGAPDRDALWPRLRALADPQAAWQKAREAAELARVATAILWQGVPPLPFNGTLSDARRIVWASFPLDDFLAMRGAAAAKVNDIVLTVIAGALRRHLAAHGQSATAPPVRALVPVSLRRDQDRLTLGNLVSAMFPTLPVDEADPLARLQRVVAETRACKSSGQERASGLFLALAGALPPPLGALFARLSPDRPLVNTVCTNVPGPRQVRRLCGQRIVEIHPIVPLFWGMGLEFAILSYADRVSICAAADPHLVPNAESIPHYLREATAELQAALGGRARPPAGEALRVRDLMTADVLTVSPDHSLGDAWELMRGHRIRHLPVVDAQRRLVGLVTHRDLLAAATSSLTFPAEHDRVFLLGGHRVAEVMETHLSTAAPDSPAHEVGDRMTRHQIGCVPIVDAEGRLAGIVTETDYLRWATARMGAPAGACDARA